MLLKCIIIANCNNKFANKLYRPEILACNQEQKVFFK